LDPLAGTDCPFLESTMDCDFTPRAEHPL
jgi:hypothetical protein